MKAWYVRFPVYRNVFKVTKVEVYKGKWTAWLQAGYKLPLSECTCEFRKTVMELKEGELLDWELEKTTCDGPSLMKLAKFLTEYSCDRFGNNWVADPRTK